MPEIPQVGFSRRSQGVFITPPAAAPSTSAADAQVAAAVSDAAFEIADFATKKLEKKREDDISFLINSEAIEARPALTKIQNDMQSEAKKNDEAFSDVAFKQAADAYRDSRLEGIVDDDVRQAVSATIDRRASPFVERAVNLSAADKDRFLLRSLGDIRKNNLEGFNAIPLDAISDAEGSPDPNKIKETMLDYFRVVSSSSDALRSSGLSPEDEHDSFSRETTDTFLRRFFNSGSQDQIESIKKQLEEGVYDNVYDDPKKISDLIGESIRGFNRKKSLDAKLDRNKLDATRVQIADEYTFAGNEALKGNFVTPDVDVEEAVSSGAYSQTQMTKFQREFDKAVETRSFIESDVLGKSSEDIVGSMSEMKKEFNVLIKDPKSTSAQKADAQANLVNVQKGVLSVFSERADDSAQQVRVEFPEDFEAFEKRRLDIPSLDPGEQLVAIRKLNRDMSRFIVDKQKEVFDLDIIKPMTKADAEISAEILMTKGGNIDTKINELRGLLERFKDPEAAAHMNIQLMNLDSNPIPFTFSTMFRFIADKNSAGKRVMRDVLDRSIKGTLNKDLAIAAGEEAVNVTDSSLALELKESVIRKDLHDTFEGQKSTRDAIDQDIIMIGKGLMLENNALISDPTKAMDMAANIVLGKYAEINPENTLFNIRVNKDIMKNAGTEPLQLKAAVDHWLGGLTSKSFFSEPVLGLDPAEQEQSRRIMTDQLEAGNVLLMWDSAEGGLGLRVATTSGTLIVKDSKGRPITLKIDKKFIQDFEATGIKFPTGETLPEATVEEAGEAAARGDLFR